MKFISRKTSGFTLIELLVVISFIGLLSSVVLASLNTARAKSRDSRRIQDLVQLRNALELYAQDHNGTYPVNAYASDHTYWDIGTWLGTTPGCPTPNGYIVSGVGSNLPMDGILGKYMSKLPTDPSGTVTNCYLYYSADGSSYKLRAYGSVETFDPLATKSPFRDLSGDNVTPTSYAPYTPCTGVVPGAGSPIRRTLAIYSPGGECF